MEEVSKKKQIKDYFIDIVSTSTFHGFPQILTRSSYILKAFWSISLLASVILCFSLIYDSFKK